LIIDCCHPTTDIITDVAGQDRNCRGIAYRGEVPKDLDRDILRPLGHSHPLEHVNESSLGLPWPNFESHTLLAACGLGESAWEEQGRGWFTKNLLNEIEKMHDISQISYLDLIACLPITPK
jgi:hypothetical protein